MKRRILKPIVWIIAIMLISPMFLASSCGSDDKDDIKADLTSRNKQLIVGSWGQYKEVQITEYNGTFQLDTIFPDQGSSYIMTSTFKANGEIISEEGIGTYSIFENTITFNTDFEEPSVFEIQSLTQNQMVLFQKVTDNDKGMIINAEITMFFEKTNNVKKK